MLNIYAITFRTATRTDTAHEHGKPDVPRKRWVPEGHWFVQPPRKDEPDKR